METEPLVSEDHTGMSSGQDPEVEATSLDEPPEDAELRTVEDGEVLSPSKTKRKRAPPREKLFPFPLVNGLFEGTTSLIVIVGADPEDDQARFGGQEREEGRLGHSL